MENRVTISDSGKHTAAKSDRPSQITALVLGSTSLLLITALVVNVLFAQQPWLKMVNLALAFATAATVFSAFSNVALRRSTHEHHLPAAPHADKLANSILRTPMRSHVQGESRNCRINKQSKEGQLSFDAMLDLQYLCVVIAAVITACLLSLALSSQLPLIPYSTKLAGIDPTLKMFIFLFGGIALVYIVHLVRKPVRALKFNKNTGVFWIEKQLVFGWKTGESAQMPIAQIAALQILSYSQKHRLQHLLSPKTAPACEFEVNVVFGNSERVNIINHTNGKALYSDAKSLAAFLDVPVWHSCHGECTG